METSINKRILCGIMAFCMILSMAIYSPQTVYATPNSTFTDAVDEFKASTPPSANVFTMDLSGRNIIGEITDGEIAALKVDYPNLIQLNVSDTFVTKLPATLSVPISIIFNNTIASGEKTITNSNVPIRVDLGDDTTHEVNISSLTANMIIGNKTLPEICEIMEYSVYDNLGNPVSGMSGRPIGTNITESELKVMGKGNYSIVFDLKYKEDPTLVSNAAAVSLTVVDSQIVLSIDQPINTPSASVPSSTYVYENGHIIFYVNKFDSSNNTVNIGSQADYTINVSGSNTVNNDIEDGKLKIDITADGTSAGGSFSISVTDASGRTTETINVDVNSLPSFSNATLTEKNGEFEDDILFYSSSTTPSAVNASIRVKRGTSAASVDLNRLHDDYGTEKTYFILTGDDIDKDLLGFVDFDLSGDTLSIRADKYIIGDDIAIVLTASPAAETDDTVTIGIEIDGTRLFTFDAVVTGEAPDAYIYYAMPANASFDGLFSSSDEILSEIDDNNPQIIEAAKYTKTENGRYVLSPGSQKINVVEDSDMRIFLVTEYNNGTALVQDPSILNWDANNTIIAASNYEDIGNGFFAKKSNHWGIDSIIVKADSDAIGQEIQIKPGIDGVGGSSLWVTLKGTEKEFEKYFFVESGTDLPTSGKYDDLNPGEEIITPNDADAKEISIGTKKDYKVVKKYNNGDVEFVTGITNEDIASSDENYFEVETNGGVITVKAGVNGSAGLDKTEVQEISYKDVKFKVVLDEPKIKGVKVFVKSPEIRIKKDDGTPDTKTDWLEDAEVQIPRGLSAQLYLRPEFTDESMNEGYDYDDHEYALGISDFTISPQGGKLSTVGGTAEYKNISASTSGNIPKIGESVKIDITYIGNTAGCMAGGVSYEIAENNELISGTRELNTSVDFKITEPIITGIDVYEADPETGDGISRVTSLEGYEGDSFTLKLKVKYSDGNDLDQILGNNTLPFGDGVYFINNSPEDYKATGPSVPEETDIYNLSSVEADVLRSHYLSSDPTNYIQTTMNSLAWNFNNPRETVKADLTNLSETVRTDIKDHAGNATGNKISHMSILDDDTGVGENIPGFYTVKLLQKTGANKDKIEFNVNYTYNDNVYGQLFIPNITDAGTTHNKIELKVKPADVYSAYLVAEGATLQPASTPGTSGKFLLDRGTGPVYNEKFWVYPVILDSRSEYENEFDPRIPDDYFDFDDVVNKDGLNFIDKDDFSDLDDKWFYVDDLPGRVTYTPTEKDGKYCLEVTVREDVADNESIIIEFADNSGSNSLNLHPTASGYQKYSFDTHEIDDSINPLWGLSLSYYAKSGMVVSEILHTITGSTDVAVGTPILVDVKYRMEDNTTSINLKDSQLPGGLGYNKDHELALDVKQISGPMNDGSTVGIAASGSSKLKFVPKSVGTYTYELSTKNSFGTVMTVEVEFESKADMLQTYNLYYMESKTIQCELGNGIEPVYVVDDSSILDTGLLEKGILKMSENIPHTTIPPLTETVYVKDSQGNSYGEFEVIMHGLEVVSELVPASGVTVGPDGFALREKISYKKNGTVTYIEYKNLQSVTDATGGVAGNFLSYDNTTGKASISNDPADGTVGLYKCVNQDGITVDNYYVVTYSETASYSNEELKFYDGSSSVTNVTVNTNDTMPQKALDVQTNGGGTPTNEYFYEITSSTGNVWVTLDVSANKLYIYAADGGTATVVLKDVYTGDIVSPQLNISAVTTEVPEYYTLSGRVTDNNNVPIVGARVEIEEITTLYTVTNSNGDYSIDNVPSGVYTVKASKTEYATDTKYNQNITSNSTLNFALDPETSSVGTYKIYGRVTDGTNPIAGAQVKVNETNQTINTNSNGNYEITGLVGNSVYTVTVTKDGYNTENGTVTITNDNEELNFVLTATGNGGSEGGSGGSGGSGGGGGGGSAATAETAECVITLKPTTIEVGETSKATAKVAKGSEDIKLSDKAVYKWTVSDENIAKIKDADSKTPEIEGLADGKVTIKLVVTDGKKTYEGTAKLTVSSASDTGSSSGAGNSSFNDVSKDFWAHDAIEYLANTGIMSGYPDGTFAPDKAITRNEFAVVTSKVMGWTTVTDQDMAEAGKHFADWNSVPDWAKEAWAAVYKNEVMMGTLKSGKYTADGARDISRQEVCVVFSRLVDDQQKSELTFADNNKIAEWAKEAVEICIGSGIISGYDDNTMRPANSTTRAQIATMFHRFLTK